MATVVHWFGLEANPFNGMMVRRVASKESFSLLIVLWDEWCHLRHRLLVHHIWSNTTIHVKVNVWYSVFVIYHLRRVLIVDHFNA